MTPTTTSPLPHPTKATGIFRSKWLPFAIAALVVVIIISVIVNANNSSADSIRAFSIGGEQTPAAGTFNKNASIEQGKSLRLYGRYDPKKLTSATIRFVHSNGKEAFKSGTFQLSEAGTFSFTMDTKSLQPGDYTVQINSDKNDVLVSGQLKITAKKK